MIKALPGGLLIDSRALRLPCMRSVVRPGKVDPHKHFDRLRLLRRYRLRGMIRCACGRLMGGVAYHSDRARTNERLAYRCIAPHDDRAPYLREDQIVPSLWEQALALLSNPDETLAQVLAARSPEAQEQRAARDLTRWSAELAEVSAQEDRLADAHLAGVPPGAISRKAVALAARRLEAESKLEALRARRAVVAEQTAGNAALRTTLFALAEAAKRVTDDQREQILRTSYQGLRLSERKPVTGFAFTGLWANVSG